jgi:group I intron endonuclease
MIGVYAIIHKPSGKFYVGSSNNTKARLTTHRRELKRNNHHCKHLQRAWSKYGETEFEFKDFLEFNTLEEARKIEQFYIDLYIKTSLFNAKNKAVGGASGEYSAAKKENWHMKHVMSNVSTEERKRRYGKALGIKNSDETKKLKSEAAKKRWADPIDTEKRKAAMKGKRAFAMCPHCNLVGSGGNMKRYHFDRCKNNESK